MRRIRFINNRRWGNRQTSVSYGMGLLSLYFRGLSLHVVINLVEWKAHGARMMRYGFTRESASFPMSEKLFLP